MDSIKVHPHIVLKMASEQDDSIITVVTCEGNISDPDFPYKLSSLVARLKRLLCSADKPFHITNVEPWNSVRVTFNIPREAAQRLRQLAHAGDRVLRDLGILSVQIEGDQVISLTIAGRFNEPQEILLQTTDDDRTRPPSSSSFDAASLETSPAASGVDSSRKNVSQFLSQQAATGTPALATPTPMGQESHFPGPLTSQADFKSPNVVAPGSEPIPFPPKSAPTPPSRTPGFGPFPFASMTHAMNTMHSSHHTATTPPQGSSPNRFPFSPPPPYPGSSSIASSGAFQPVRPSSYTSSMSTTASATVTTASSSSATTSPTVINNLPRGVADRANAALTSPLLVNLLQSDLSGSSQQQHSGGKVFPPPPSEPVAAPKRRRKPRKSKEKPLAEGALSSPGASPTAPSSSCLSSSSHGLPASESSPHSIFTQPFTIALPTVPSIPLSPSLTPPSISPPSLIGQPLTPTDAMAKPFLTHHFPQHHLHHRIPPMPSPPPTAPPSSASTSNNSGQSSQEAEHELSPWPSPSKRTQHLINPFTGQLEPMSSDEDEEDFADHVQTSDQCLEAVSESPCSSLQSNPFSEVGKSNDSMPNIRRMSTETTPSPSTTESKVRETVPAGTKEMPPTASPPSPAPSTSPAASATQGNSTSEKIKLRLKLEPKSRVEKDKDCGRLGEKQKTDGVLSMLQYKVDVSFVNIPSRRVSTEVSGATTVATASIPVSTMPLVNSGNILGSLAGGSVGGSGSGNGMANVTNANNSNMPSEPRVPPLHISLRGRNAAVVTNPRREMRMPSREIGDTHAYADSPAAGKMPRSKSPRGFLMERGGRSAGMTWTQNQPGRKVAPSRGGGNSRRGRGTANPTMVSATTTSTTVTSVTTGCSSTAAAIISVSATTRNVISVVTQQHPALEGRALAASPPGVAREKTLLSGGSFVLEPGRPSTSPSPTKQTAQVPNVLQGNGPPDMSTSAAVTSVQIPRMDAEGNTEGTVEKKLPHALALPHHQEQQQFGATNSGRDSSRGRATTEQKVDVEDGISKDAVNALRENNHNQLSMQQQFVEERLKPSNPTTGKVNLATSELNALLDRPVSPYNPNMTRRNSAEGAKSENLVRPALAKGMHEALATHSMRSKFQNALSTHQRNVLDERLQHNLEIAFPSESMQRERLKDALRPEMPKVAPGRRSSRERTVSAGGMEACHTVTENQPSRTSPTSSQTVKQLIPEEPLSDVGLPVYASGKEAEFMRSSPRLRTEPIPKTPLTCHTAVTEIPSTKDRAEMLAGQLSDTNTQECDMLRTSDNSKVCSTVPTQFVKSPTLLTVSPTCDHSDGDVLLFDNQRETILESPSHTSCVNKLTLIPESTPAMPSVVAEEKTSSQNSTVVEAVQVSSEPGFMSESCKAVTAQAAEKTNAEICTRDLLAVVVSDRALVESNQIMENYHATNKEEVMNVKRPAVVSCPDETEVPLMDVDLPPQIPGIRRSSKVSVLGQQEKLCLATTIGASGISQLVPSHGGSVLMDDILPMGQMDGLPEEEGDGDAEFGPVESMPHHHHLLNSVARSTSVAIVTITASPSSASPSGSSPDSLNIGGTSSEENGDQIVGRGGHGDHRGRHHPFPRNQCGSSGSPYEDSGIDSMDAIMEKLPDDLSPSDKADDVTSTSTDPPLPTSTLTDSAQQADGSILTQKSIDKAVGTFETTACDKSESTDINNQNYEPGEKEPVIQSVMFHQLPATSTLSLAADSSAPTASDELDSNVAELTSEVPTSNIAPTEESVDETSIQNGRPTDSTDNSHVVLRERAMSQEILSADSTVEMTASQDDERPEPLHISSDAPSSSSESVQTLQHAVDMNNSEDPKGSSGLSDAAEEKPNMQLDAMAESAPQEMTREISTNPPVAKIEVTLSANSEQAAEAISMGNHSIIDMTQEEFIEDTTNLLASVVFEEQDGRSGEHVAIVTEGDLTEPESPSGTTQLLVFTVEDMDSLMMSDNADHEMSLVQVTPTNEDGSATLEFSTLGQSDSDRGEGIECGSPYAACLTAALQSQATFLADGYHSGDGSHLTENCIESAKGIAVVQVQLAKEEPEDEVQQRDENDLEHQTLNTERRHPDTMISAATVMVQVSDEENCSKVQNNASEPNLMSSTASLGQMVLPNNISLLGGTSHSSLQSTYTNSSLLTVNSGGAGSTISNTFVQNQSGEITLHSLSPSSTVPLKVVTLPPGMNSQMGGVSENGSVVSLAYPISSPAILPASPVKVVMSRVCVASTASTVTLTTVFVKSPTSPSVSGLHSVRPAITSTATVGIYPIMSSTAGTSPTAASLQTASLQVPTIVPINSTFPTSPGASMVTPPLVRPTANEGDAVPAPKTNNTFNPIPTHASATILTSANVISEAIGSTSRSMTASCASNSPPRSRAWLFPNVSDCASAVQNSASTNSTAIVVASEHALLPSPRPSLSLAISRTTTPSPTPLLSLMNSMPVGLSTHFVPLPVVINEGKQDSMESDADTNCSSSSMSSESGHHHHSDTGQEDGCYSKDEADDMYMGNTSITSGDHNYIFRASRTMSKEKERNRLRTNKEERETEKQSDIVPSVENCSCNSSAGSPDRNSIGDSNKLEQLSIEIPADNDVCEVERRATRSTRSNSRLASPNSGRLSVASQQLSPNVNSCIVSPVPLPGTVACEVENEVRTLPNRTAAKRRREDSDSDSERLKAIQNSHNAHGGVAMSEKDEAVASTKVSENDIACPKSPVYGNVSTNAHVYSKPVKRKCSENAVELIKACIGVDDNPKRATGGKQQPSVDGTRTPVVATKNMKPKEDGAKSKGRINASTGEGLEESSDDEVTLSELVTKARSGKAKQVGNNATEDRSITRNSKQRQNVKEEDVSGGGKIERVNSRSNSKREDVKGAKATGAQRESRKEERASSRLGGRHPDKGRRTSPQTRGQERSPQRINHRSKTKEHDRATSPSTLREENDAGKRKLRSSGSSGYYDSLPQKRRRFSRDNR